MKTGTSGKPRVFVVEHEAIAREILADLLRMAGYDVVAARTGEQALPMLMQERGRIDCLFTAIDLPGLVDGWMLVEEFRTADATRPVVLSCAAKPAKSRRLGGVAFVARPILPPKVVEAVNKVTGRGEAVARSRRAPPRVIDETAASMPPEAPSSAEAPELVDAPGELRRAVGQG